MKITKYESDRTMRLKIKDLNTSSMAVTEKGIELAFYEVDGKAHSGDLIITPTQIIWNKGKTSKSGKSINWPEFFKLMSKRPQLYK